MILQAMKQALEALRTSPCAVARDAEIALRVAIEQMAKAEPVAWMHEIDCANWQGASELRTMYSAHKTPVLYEGRTINEIISSVPLYTHPSQPPEGWQLVPVEPTKAMLEVWKNWGGPEERNYVVVKRRELYKAMLAAAPKEKS